MTHSLEPASMGRRLIAGLVDGVVLTFAGATLINAGIFDPPPMSFMQQYTGPKQSNYYLLYITLLAASFLVSTLMLSRFQASLGRLAAGVRILGSGLIEATM